MKTFLRTFFVAISFTCLILFSQEICAQSVTPGYSPTSQDFELPIQDLVELKGEVIWLQGGLKRGDPTPYQNPRLPLAGYEQGLLDRDGKLWTFLDTPKGRELRYNKELRAKVVEVKGWVYDKTQIIEVYSWKDAQSHPVRLDSGFPEPIKVPFQAERAETIEPIPPVTPEVPGKGLIGEDMWKLKEGLDLLDDDSETALPLPPSGVEGDLLQRFLQDSEMRKNDSEGGVSEELPNETLDSNSTPPAPEQIDLREESGASSALDLPPLPRRNGPVISEPGTGRIDEGLTDPEEMFEESRRALLEQ